MPFSDPRPMSFHFGPNKYEVELVAFQDVPPSPEHPDWTPSMRWIFNVYDLQTHAPIMNDDDEPAQFCPLSGSSVGPKSKTARPWLEALLGRPIEPTDTGRGLQAEAIGKRAIAMIDDNDRGYSILLSLRKLPAKKSAAVSAEDDN